MLQHAIAQTVRKLVRSHTSRLKPPAAPLEPARLLIVDDEPLVLRFVARVLVHAGYDTATAGDGPEALAVAARIGPIDLLLSDFRMPHMNGDRLAAKMRESEPDLKVLYLTGFSDQLFKDKGSLWNGEAFLDKPCSVKGLLEAVSLMLCGHLRPALLPSVLNQQHESPTDVLQAWRAADER